MLITVNEVLKLEGFKDSIIVAGKEGLSNVVNNATLMEVPDIFHYVDENSLLITTLYPIYDNENATKDLIPKLAELKLAGICIKPIRYIDEIPLEMIKQANKLNFPIIELPESANLSNLVMQILDLSLNKHIDILNFRNYVHEHLMSLFLKGEDINSLVNNLAKIVKFPIILLDNNLNIICMSNDLIEEEVSIVSSYNIYDKDDFIIRIKDNDHYEKSYIKYSINAGKTKFGYIVLLKGDVESQSLIVAVEQASLLIASVFYKNYAVLEKEKTFQDSFIRDILQGKISSNLDTISKAKAFGWNIEFPQVLIVIKILIDNEKKKKEIYEYVLDSRMIEKILKEKMGIDRNRFKSIYLDDSLVLFINTVSIDKYNIKESIIEVGNLIIEKLKKNIKVGIGISNIVNDINGFSLAYKEAHNSLDVGSILNDDSFISHYDDYKIFNVIKEVKDNEVLIKYVEDKLGKIIKYDKSTDMNLMRTLRVLIEENFNAKKASKKLFIHYNTLRHRIERLKELGINIENGFEIGEIVLAYNIYLWINANID